MTKNTSVVVKRVPASKAGGLLAKIKAINAAAAALQSNSTKYGSDDENRSLSMSVSSSSSAVPSRLGSVSNDKWSMSVLAVHRYVGFMMLDRERFLERFLLLLRRLHSQRLRGCGSLPVPGSFTGPACGGIIFRFNFILALVLLLYFAPPFLFTSECRRTLRPLLAQKPCLQYVMIHQSQS